MIHFKSNQFNLFAGIQNSLNCHLNSSKSNRVCLPVGVLLARNLVSNQTSISVKSSVSLTATTKLCCLIKN